MKHRTRIYFNAEQRADIWDRWQRGESMSSIGRLFARESSSIYPILQPAVVFALLRERAHESP